MMNEPLISVIIPFYNEERYIKKSIYSIINQTYRNLEIILIDDASNDNSLTIVKAIKDNRLKIIQCRKNIGRSAIRNIGINEANGDYVAMMDADDVCDSYRIEKQLKMIYENGENIVCGTSIIVKTHNKELIKSLPVNHKEIVKGFNRVINRVTFVAGTMICKTDLLKKFNYRNKFKYFEDWDLLLRLNESKEVRFCNVSEPLYTYIIRGKSSRYEHDWYDYNIFVRNCQSRRRKKLNEYDSLYDFNLYLKNNLFKNIYYNIMKILIYVKRKYLNISL